MEQENKQALICHLEGYRVALPLEIVSQVIRAVNITPVPGVPPQIKGAINLHGFAVPVIDLRFLFGLPERKLKVSDRFIILDIHHRKLAIIADDTENIIPFPPLQASESHRLRLDLSEAGVVIADGKLVLLADPEKFLSYEDGIQLDAIIQKLNEENSNDPA